MNVDLNGNLARVLVIRINVLLTPKKKASLLWPQRCFTLSKKLQYVYLFYKVLNN